MDYHSGVRPGKTETVPSKPFESPAELALAYTPGVSVPAMEIYKRRWNAYRYTNKGNLVAVISDGSSVLGLGNIGALASKPVMEGKAMLFKVYADIDAFDIELGTGDPDRFIAAVQAMAPTFGGINLEDIKSPECFYIEERLRGLLDIPVLHDDQHGTAVVVTAALINACHIVDKELSKVSIVICGAGAAAISVARMLLVAGACKENIVMVDSKGVVSTERSDINSIKAEFATTREYTTLSQAMSGADVFIGLSRGNLLSDKDIMSMAENAIILALANPTPEVEYKHAKAIRPDAIVATGRSDAPNQINNLLAFPYLFRGAMDTFSTTINEMMTFAAAQAIADVARQKTDDEINAKYGTELIFGKEYIIPKPGDKRLLCSVSSAVARAAMECGVARRKINSFKEYCDILRSRIEESNLFCKENVRHRLGEQHNKWQKLKEF